MGSNQGCPISPTRIALLSERVAPVDDVDILAGMLRDGRDYASSINPSLMAMIVHE
jgi:hypothetical protein